MIEYIFTAVLVFNNAVFERPMPNELTCNQTSVGAVITAPITFPDRTFIRAYCKKEAVGDGSTSKPNGAQGS